MGLLTKIKRLFRLSPKPDDEGGISDCTTNDTPVVNEEPPSMDEVFQKPSLNTHGSSHPMTIKKVSEDLGVHPLIFETFMRPRWVNARTCPFCFSPASSTVCSGFKREVKRAKKNFKREYGIRKCKECEEEIEDLERVHVPQMEKSLNELTEYAIPKVRYTVVWRSTPCGCHIDEPKYIAGIDKEGAKEDAYQILLSNSDPLPDFIFRQT